jgi:Protein of unknown function (DUF2769)
MAKVPDTPENMARCLCGGCPTYPGEGRATGFGRVPMLGCPTDPGEGGFFCAKGKSAKEITRKGCLCGDCQNFKDFDLTDGYFCANGQAG